MKGAALPIETIIILTLAVIVFGILLWFFASSSSPAIDLTLLKEHQSIYCSSYQRLNPECTINGHGDVIGPGLDQNTGLIDNIVRTCYNLDIKEGGYASCDSETMNPDDAYTCIADCCKTYCVG